MTDERAPSVREAPNEEIAASSGTLRDVAYWLDTGKGRRPDGVTLRSIADVIDRLAESSAAPAGEFIRVDLTKPDDYRAMESALAERDAKIARLSAPPKDGEVAALIERLRAYAKDAEATLRPMIPLSLGTVQEIIAALVRLSAPVPGKEK